VILTVSKGPDIVTVPDVQGQPVDAAIAAIKAAGLVPEGPYGPGSSTVFFTRPGGGQKVKRGTKVNIYSY
jgi:beta-lactam-binding protein with PASTA domain